MCQNPRHIRPFHLHNLRWVGIIPFHRWGLLRPIPRGQIICPVTQLVNGKREDGTQAWPTRVHACNHYVHFPPRVILVFNGPPRKCCPHWFWLIPHRIDDLARLLFGFYTFWSWENSYIGLRMLWQWTQNNRIILNCLTYNYLVPNLIFPSQTGKSSHPEKVVFWGPCRKKLLPTSYLLRLIFKGNNSFHFLKGRAIWEYKNSFNLAVLSLIPKFLMGDHEEKERSN